MDVCDSMNSCQPCVRCRDSKPSTASAGYSVVAIAAKFKSFISCQSSPDSKPEVVFEFQSLEQAHEFYSAVCKEIKTHKI